MWLMFSFQVRYIKLRLLQSFGGLLRGLSINTMKVWLLQTLSFAESVHERTAIFAGLPTKQNGCVCSHKWNHSRKAFEEIKQNFLEDAAASMSHRGIPEICTYVL